MRNSARNSKNETRMLLRSTFHYFCLQDLSLITTYFLNFREDSLIHQSRKATVITSAKFRVAFHHQKHMKTCPMRSFPNLW